MEIRELSNTGLKLSCIGLGGWQFAGRGTSTLTYEKLKQKEINEIVDTAAINNINWFDTAQRYGNGQSERSLSTALKWTRLDYPVVMTKWNPMFKKASDMYKDIDERKENLNPYSVTVYQVHTPNSMSSISEQMKVLADLVKKAKIGYVGVSNFSVKEMILANNSLERYGVKLVSNQIRYNLLKRDVDYNGMFQACEEYKITPIIYSPLEKGLLSGHYHFNQELIQKLPLLRKIKFNILIEPTKKLIDYMRVLAIEHKCTISNIAISWILNKRRDTLVILGVSNKYQLSENIKSVFIKLSKSEIEELDYQSSKLSLFYV